MSVKTHRYVVVGAGGVGGVAAGFLAAAGEDVLLVARGEHGRCIRSSGLLVGTPRGSFTVQLPVISSIEEWRPAERDVLIMAVKSQDALHLFAQIASLRVADSFVGQRIPLLCFQNGVSNERTALRYFSNVHGVCVGLPGVYLQPGRVDAHGSPVPGVLEIGRYPGGSDELDVRVVEALAGAGFRAHVTDEILSWKAGKLLGNLRNAIDALFPEERGSVDVQRLAHMAEREARSCFAAAGIPEVDTALVEEHRAGFSEESVDGTARAGGSTWQSVARGLPSVETDFLNGEIVLLGRLHGLPTPANSALQEKMWALLDEDRRDSAGTAAALIETLSIDS